MITYTSCGAVWVSETRNLESNYHRKRITSCRVGSSVSHCQSQNHLSSRAKRMPRSNEGLTLDTLALESFNGDNLTSSTCLIPNLVFPKARFKRRTLHVPNLMQMRKIHCFRSFALDSAHVKFDV